MLCGDVIARVHSNVVACPIGSLLSQVAVGADEGHCERIVLSIHTENE